jgi:putative hydrolase of the HAD superfamily
MKKKAIFFDLDNTLCNEREPREEAIKALHKVFNEHHKMGSKEFERLYNASRAEIQKEIPGTASSFNRALYLKRLFEKTHNRVDPTLILKMYDVYWKAYLSNLKPFEDAIPMLKQLKSMGMRTAIITNLTLHIQLRKLERLGISEYIDVFVVSEEVLCNKPHPGPFNFALNKMKLKPDEVMMVGDRIDSDIEGANAAGIDSVLISKESVEDFPEGDLRKPDPVINNLKELLDLVKS